MNDPVRISAGPPARLSTNYGELRSRGITLIQQLCTRTWTDHNRHDPGITILEAFVYAMTELGMRAGLDVADLLESGLVHAPTGLVPAHRVLPCRPVTLADLRALVLDHPLVRDAWVRTDAIDGMPFFEGPDPTDPNLAPLVYVGGGERVRPKGLYDVVVAFDEPEWNENIDSFELEVAGQTRGLDLALPYWDDPEVAPLRAGATIDSIDVNPTTGAWRPLEELQSYFGVLRVHYTDSGGSAFVDLWVVLQVTTPTDLSAGELSGILASAAFATALLERIEAFNARVLDIAEGVARVLRYVERRRNLCEVPVRLLSARVQEVAVDARIEVTGGADLEQILASIFAEIDRALSPPLRFDPRPSDPDASFDPDEVFDGPLLEHGLLAPADGERLVKQGLLYTSDILRLIMAHRNQAADAAARGFNTENPTGRDIVAVSHLRLSNYVNNRPVTGKARNCLRLLEVDLHRPRLSLTKSHITFLRDGVEVPYDHQAVASIFAELTAAAAAADRPEDPSLGPPAPRGEVLPIEDYLPFQNELPRVYGVGDTGLAAGASMARMAQTLQAKGYLLVFEQFLADYTSQLGHINRFFSPSAGETSTYFVKDLLDQSGMARLVRRFAGTPTDWSDFVADPDNAYRQALEGAVEDRSRFLDRRNRMFDHLLARQGEDMVAWGQELHRWGVKELSAAPALTATQRVARIEERRQVVNAILIEDKADLLAETPELNHARLLALGMPTQWQHDFISVVPVVVGHAWEIVIDGTVVLASGAGQEQPTVGAARIAAEEALVLAGRTSILDPVPPLLGTLLFEQSLSPMERRIVHLTGIDTRVRRRLLEQTNLYFELVDDPSVAPDVGRRWNLHESTDGVGPTGAVLLRSGTVLVGATVPDAEELAQASIEELLRRGLDDWSYEIEPDTVDPELFRVSVELDGLVLARDPGPGMSEEDAIAHATTTRRHLHRHLGAEGFHLVEHILLRPRLQGDQLLTLPLEPGFERDPYSHRLTLVFPSGYARNFADTEAVPEPVRPHRFRDPEFRRHAERMTRLACPAHLMLSIHWVDQRLPDTAASPASFDAFEARFLAWLDDRLFGAGSDATLRNALVESINAIATG